MTKKDVDITIGADASGLTSSLAQARAAVTGATSEMQARFNSLKGVLSNLQGYFVAFTAVLAGGSMFKEAIAGSVKLNVEATELGKSFGLSASQASVLRIALDDVFVTQEQFEMAAGKITQTLNKNEEAFTRLGVSTRDSDGNFRNTADIILDVNAKLLTLKEGTDRNVEGVKIYGKSWAAVAPTLRLTQEAMEGARAKGEALGLTVSAESQANTQRYRQAMQDVGDVVEGLGNAIGQALMPGLSEMGEWFASVGPQAVQAMRVAMVGFVTVFAGLKATLIIGFELIKNGLQQLVIYFLSFSEAAGRALRLDFAGARTAWTTGMDQIRVLNSNTASEIERRWAEARDTVANSMEGAFGKKTETKGPGGSGLSEGGAGTSKSQTSKWETELAEAKAAYSAEAAAAGQFREFSLQMERDFWQRKLALVKGNSEEAASVQRKLAGLELSILKEKFSAEMAAMKDREAAFQNDASSRLEIAKAYAARMGEAYGLESKEYADARRNVVTVERQVQDQLRQIRDTQYESGVKAALSQIDMEEQNAQTEVELRQKTSAELLGDLEQFENRRNEIKTAALQRSLELALQDPDRNPVQIAQLHAQIEELELNHQERLNELRNRKLKEATKSWLGPIKTMETGFASSISNMLKGTESFGAGMRKTLVGAVGAMIDMLAQEATKFLAVKLFEMVTGQTAARAGIAGHAAEAGAAAFASTAAIPIIGPALAPGAAAAAYAGAMSYQAFAAERGFDIPAGLNPKTQLHEREMVLPAELADTIRQMAGQGGAPGASARPVIIQTMDARGVRNWAKNPANRRAIYEAAAAHSNAKFGRFK